MPTEFPRAMSPEDLARPPAYATRRNPALRTRGGKVGVIARAMGRPLFPHQQYIADVTGELNPPGADTVFRYPLVLVSLPRQTGKTTLVRPVAAERCMARPRTATFMTAQLGKYAAARWRDLVDDIESHPVFASFVKVNRGKGDERCAFPNGSFISPFAPGPLALHSESPDLVMIDEGWAFSEEDGDALLKAIRPAMQTRRARQLWIISAAGDASSKWWDQLCAEGEAATKDPNSTTAFFRWAMADGADPYDPASWEFHPGLDGLITPATLAEEAKPESNTLAAFLRGFMNVPTKQRATTVFDLDAWDALHDPTQRPADPGVTAYAYDVALDRSSASIWAAWLDDAGRLQLHVVETRPGAAWVVDYMTPILEAGDVGVVAADDGGPARVVTDTLTRAGYTVETLTGRDYATAWTSFKGHVSDGTLRHDGSPALRGAIEVAAEKAAGDALAPSRRHSLGPIDPLIAASTAAWFAARAGSSIPIY